MIIAEQKPFERIVEMTAKARNILVAGCGTCVTVCLAGGAKEVAVVASKLRLAAQNAGRKITVTEATIERQCENEFVEKLAPALKGVDTVVSLACGIGVQFLAEAFQNLPILPGVNTRFLGAPSKQGTWQEKCMACGDCRLDKTAGVCPMARCSKNLLNGPCGGSANGKCEVNPQKIECAWQLIIDRMEKLGRLDELEAITPPNDWSTAHDGGVRETASEQAVPAKTEAMKSV
ncbi:MAG: methylenetetrahydrofolate reductase C-terminal domain-containing protein [Planctomycetota bacterium]|nr:methylenetetrahydrofolate reductase C-terminal domain-containing protein [Planctomycetota bacterium]